MGKIIVSTKGIRLLKKSIKEKWGPIVDGTGTDNGVSDCALCGEFLKKGCEGCPVCIKTGVRGCEKTPRREWNEHHEKAHHLPISVPFRIQCPICTELAKKMLGFLEELYKELTLTITI